MFRVVNPGEEAGAVEFLSREPDANYFLLGDLEAFTLNDPNLSLWADMYDGHAAVLLRYWAGYVIYAPGGADWEGAARIMREHGYGVLSGQPQYVQPMLEQLGGAPEINVNILMRLLPGELSPQGNGRAVLRVDAGNLDSWIGELVALRGSISEFSVGLNVEALREELQMGCRRILLATEGGRAVAMAMTSVERKQAAMIVSVCTHPDWRGRGYAGALMTALCDELGKEGKTALLFYKNPVAGRIYQSLGFRDIGRWCYASF